MKTNLASFALRLGLAFTFFYAAVSGLADLQDWIGYFPAFLKNTFPNTLLSGGFSAAEIFLALWLISGIRARWSAAVSALLLAGITLFNLGVLEVTFRDVGLFFAAAALFFLSDK